MPSFTQQLKLETATLYLAWRHPRTPWYAKVMALVVVAYAFSPIDLIPDFVPVLGYLDDALILPLGVWLTRRLIPVDILAECRAQAQTELQTTKSVRWVGALVIVLLWIVALALTLMVILAISRNSWSVLRTP
jgi:uncharacterized membrane protein YkvA (DUF1232 family)